MIKKIIEYFLFKISRVIYLLIPSEFKKESPLFETLLDKTTKENFDYFGKYFPKTMIFHTIKSIQKYAIEIALENDKAKNKFYLEFGVWKGDSANFFSDYVTIYAFDSFEGLKEDWMGTDGPKGTFNLNKKIPKLKKNVQPIVGWVQDTLEDFLVKHNPSINFVNLDMDTYETSKYVLEKIKPYLIQGAIILFDELYNFPGWRHHEFKALQEVFEENEYIFKAFNLSDKQVVIKIN